MTASEEAKQVYGFRSLRHAAGIYGCSTKTLHKYWREDHKKFTIIMTGAAAQLKENEIKDPRSALAAIKEIIENL